MIIKPYINKPKFSKLKIGDKIRFSDDIFMERGRWYFMRNKLVTILTIYGGFIKIREHPNNAIHIAFFEIEDDRDMVWINCWKGHKI